jgi:hypothetical protein
MRVHFHTWYFKSDVGSTEIACIHKQSAISFGLFNDAVSNSDYITSIGRMMYWNNTDGSGHVIFQGTTSEIFWSDWVRSRKLKNLGGSAGIRNRLRNRRQTFTALTNLVDFHYILNTGYGNTVIHLTCFYQSALKTNSHCDLIFVVRGCENQYGK